MDYQQPDWIEYLIFIVIVGLVLLITARYFLKKTRTLDEVVWGTGQLGVFPITLSIFATSISTIAASIAAEYYQYGINIIFENVAVIATGISIFLQAPVLFPLKFVSVNEYFALRFDASVKNFIAVVIMISQMIYATVVCFSLAVQAETIFQLSVTKCFVATFFSCFSLAALGGFEGVVWTDTLQAVVMIVSSVVLSFAASASVGGFNRVYDAARETGRLTIDFDLDHTKRMNSWTVSLSYTPLWIAFGSLFNPAIYQRYVALGKNSLRMAVYIVVTVIVLYKLLVCYFGLTMYAYYHGCDPVASAQIDKYDQLLPLFINQIGQRNSFFRGLFNAGLFCSAVSTLTTMINTFGVVIYRDFLEKTFNSSGQAIRAKLFIILTELAMFVTCTSIYLCIENQDSITALVPLYSTPAAIYVSSFALGMFNPVVNARGILTGTLLCLPLSLLMTWGNNVAVTQGLIKYPSKPMSVDRCDFNLTAPDLITSTYYDEKLFPLFRLSPFLNPVIIFTANCIICTVTSLIFKRISNYEPPVDPNLISPLCRRFIPKPRGVIQRDFVNRGLRTAEENESLAVATS